MAEQPKQYRTAGEAHAASLEADRCVQSAAYDLLAACEEALFDLTARSSDMKERSKELSGENRKASELLEYFAPDPKGKTVKMLRAAITRATGNK